jgi:hypothetical protein
LAFLPQLSAPNFFQAESWRPCPQINEIWKTLKSCKLPDINNGTRSKPARIRGNDIPQSLRIQLLDTMIDTQKDAPFKSAQIESLVCS